MKTAQQIHGATTDELRAWHRNAMTTFARCGGHKKAQRNYDAGVLYATEMNLRGMASDKMPGIFNGPGSV